MGMRLSKLHSVAHVLFVAFHKNFISVFIYNKSFYLFIIKVCNKSYCKYYVVSNILILPEQMKIVKLF